MSRLLVPCLLFCLSAPAVAEKVRIAVNHAPPYRILDETPPTGLYIDVMNALARELDWQPVYIEVPFRRVLWLMEKGEADIMLGALPTTERQRYMDFVVPAFPAEPKLFFYRAPEHRVHRYEDLSGRTIGVLRGSRYHPDFDRDQTLHREAASDYSLLMQMLAMGRLDLVVAPELAGRHEAAQIAERLSSSPFRLPGEPSYIALSRQSGLTHQRQRLMDAFDRLQQSGVIDSILAGYQESPSPDPEPEPGSTGSPSLP